VPRLRHVSGVDELITWLRAQLDDDERKVAAMEREQRRVRTAPIFQGHPPNWLAGVDIFVSPERWRAEVEAKRRIVELHTPADDGANEGKCWTCEERLCDTLLLLAQPYAAREGWREEWAS
jgi:hypothetical protein